MKVKNLTNEPPRSPHQRIHDYVILARTLDKCRASLNGTQGEYYFDCPLDKMLFDFKGIDSGNFLEEVKSGASDEEMGKWLDTHGSVQTPGSISCWGRNLETYRPYDNPEKREWFVKECKRFDLNPATTTLFTLLEADDRAAFPGSKPSAWDTNTWDLPMVETAPGCRQTSLRSVLHQ